MTTVKSLRIKLGQSDVGSLFGLDDGRVYFRFDDTYALNPDRPILSASILGGDEAETRLQLLDPLFEPTFGSGGGRLPVFFRNLLPEGVLRKQLISDAALSPDDELGLLAYCGTDLPGDVWALSETLDEAALGRLLTQGQDSYEMSSHQLPTPEAVSLSGVQPKVSLVDGPGGRYVMRSKQLDGRHYIGKLPASDYAGLPEVEHLSLQLAAAADVKVCTAELMPLTAIADKLPFSLRDDARNFLLVHRFDRDADTPTGRIHMEDFGQVLQLAPDEKYKGTYAAIGIALRYVTGSEDDLFELLRRIKVNELLGNYDAHVKNFSILYTNAGPRLSPAYDIVAYASYFRGKGNALKFFEEQTKTQSLSPKIVRMLSNAWELTETRMTAVLTDTVDKAMRTWPEMIQDSTISDSQKKQLLEHLEEEPSAAAWKKRQATRAAA